jgi:hypothetical protein
VSETVHYKGTLTKVEKLENETLEEQCKMILENKELPKWFDSYVEFLFDECYKEYAIYENELYFVDKKSVDADTDMFISSKNEDGTINFEVKYYNGGCGFEEAIETALKNIKSN